MYMFSHVKMYLVDHKFMIIMYCVPCSCSNACGSDWSRCRWAGNSSEHLWTVPFNCKTSDHWCVCWLFHTTDHKWWCCWVLAALPVWQRQCPGDVSSFTSVVLLYLYMTESENVTFCVTLFLTFRKWNKETFDYLLSFLNSPQSVRMGIFLQSGYNLCTEPAPVSRTWLFENVQWNWAGRAHTLKGRDKRNKRWLSFLIPGLHFLYHR